MGNLVAELFEWEWINEMIVVRHVTSLRDEYSRSSLMKKGSRLKCDGRMNEVRTEQRFEELRRPEFLVGPARNADI